MIRRLERWILRWGARRHSDRPLGEMPVWWCLLFAHSLHAQARRAGDMTDEFGRVFYESFR